jgi:hypothetical protein
MIRASCNDLYNVVIEAGENKASNGGEEDSAAEHKAQYSLPQRRRREAFHGRMVK